MTDLEKKVAELRNKYESSVKTYLEAYGIMYDRMMEVDVGPEYTRLYDLDRKWFPFDTCVAAKNVIAMGKFLDEREDAHDVFKNAYIREFNKWVSGMNRLEI